MHSDRKAAWMTRSESKWGRLLEYLFVGGFLGLVVLVLILGGLDR
jgi:hypothetical protein